MTTPDLLRDPDRICGYDYASTRLTRSPLTVEELRELEAAAGLSEADSPALRRAGQLLSPHAGALVDRWREQLGHHPHLAAHGAHPDGSPNPGYAAASHPRFARWVIDMCTRPRDQRWLDYQYEIGRRHTTDAKNATDGAASSPFVPMRHLLAFVPAILIAVHDVLSASDDRADDVRAMQDAVTKSVLLHVTVWTRAYMDHPDQW